MLSSFENLLAVLATVAVSITFLYVLQRVWPSELRRQNNELIGWHIGVLGSTYAVILGFMLFAVWTNFETADANADAEANCLVSLVRFSRALPAPQKDQVRSLSNQYVNIVLGQDWPAMSRGEVSSASHPVVRRLWSVLVSTDVRSAREQAALDHAFTELSRMTEYRRLRELQVEAYLPGVLWFVLILGAMVTIISACLFGTSKFRVHVIQVVLLALMISSILVAISDINSPYQGGVHVDPAGFEQARITLSDIP